MIKGIRNNHHKYPRTMFFNIMLAKREGTWTEGARLLGLSRTTFRHKIMMNSLTPVQKQMLTLLYNLTETEQRKLFGGE